MRVSKTQEGTCHIRRARAKTEKKNKTPGCENNTKKKYKKTKKPNKPRVCRVGSYPETMKKVKLVSIKEGA